MIHKVMHNPPWVSIVIPTLNEAKNLPFLLPAIPEWVYEIIIVDGNSTDDTVEVAKKLHPAVRVFYQKGRGKGDALREGFSAVKGDIIVMMDADGSNDPAEIQVFVSLLRRGVDLVKGSRYIQGGGSGDMTISRQMGNWGLMMLTRLAFGGHFTDFCYGYIAFWSKYLSILYPEVDGFEVEALINLRALSYGLKVAEVPSYEALRKYGESHLKAIPDGWRILKLILREWSGWLVARPAPTSFHVEPSIELIPVTADKTEYAYDLVEEGEE